MRYLLVLGIFSAFLAGCASDRCVTRDSLIAARKQAAHGTRRIIMNNDGNDCRQFDPDEPRTVEIFLSKRVSPLVGTHVDAIFYCSGVFNLYTHKSDETEPLGVGETAQWAWSPELIRQGTDSLEVVIDFGHAHEMEVFWSMRMNDTHDSDNRNSHLFCQWKKDHPECLMRHVAERFMYGGRRWSALNYARPAVRDKVFCILEDVCTRYDVDGVELDFFRHPVYFPPQITGGVVTEEHCDQMTALLRRIRKMTEDVGLTRNRPILIAVRVPDSIGYAKAIGLDLIQWLEEDLVDIVSGSGYFHLEPWENLVALGRQYDVPVYAVISGSRMVDPSHPEGKGAIRAWRGEAANAWGAGVDGIYTFNRFDPLDPIFRELGDPVKLETLESTYRFNEGTNIESWLKGGKRFLKEPEE